jgi:hypothetical protein
MNNVGLAAHRLVTACPTALPTTAPCPGNTILPAEPDASSCPTTAPPTARPSTRSPAGRSGLSTCAPAPTGHAPTAKPNDSSARCSGWAYGAISRNYTEREATLSGWLDFYNRRRPHGSLGHQAPIDRLTALQTGAKNLVGSYKQAKGTRPPYCDDRNEVEPAEVNGWQGCFCRYLRISSVGPLPSRVRWLVARRLANAPISVSATGDQPVKDFRASADRDPALS